MAADPEVLRAELRAHGEQIREAQRADAEAHEAVARLIPAAIAAGLSRHEIAALAGVGRPWINKILAQRS